VGDRSVASLILRLEPLLDAAAEQDDSASRTQEARRVQQIGAALDAANHDAGSGASPGSAASASGAARPNGSVVEPNGSVVEGSESGIAPLPTPDSPAPRRVVDVAGPERLSVATPLTRWAAAVAAAHDACIVIDSNGILISVSVAAAELLGCGEATIIGRHILDILHLVDLDTGAPEPDYAERITPLAVLDNPGLSRSLIRVRHADGVLVTLDTSSAAVRDITGYTLGSVTFLAPIRCH